MRQTKLQQISVLILLLIGTVIFASGCDDSFQPLAENNDLFFSIYGSLDASADTQNIRVTAVRKSILPDPGTADATVTLEHVGTGQKAILQDSLYTFNFDDIHYARNYLTDMNLDPGETYHLVAEQGNGRVSEATVTLPEDFPEPEYNLVCNDTPTILTSIELYIDDIENLAAVTAYYYYESVNTGNPHQSRLTVQQYDNVRELSDGGYFARVNVVQDLTELLGINGSISHIRIDRISVFVAKAGPDWPETEGLSDEEQLLPDAVNNIENGIGFLGGIVSKTITVDSSCI